MWETRVPSLGWEDPLEEGTATHSSILAWRIPWTTVYGVKKSWTRLSKFHFQGKNNQRRVSWGKPGGVWAAALQRPARGGVVSALRGGCEHTLGWQWTRLRGCGGGTHHDDCERALNDRSCVPGLDRAWITNCVPLVGHMFLWALSRAHWGNDCIKSDSFQ